MILASSLCYLCGAPGADSRDHVPARALFYPQRPSDLLTLPAHYRCQQAFSRDEEYAFAFLRQADWENRLEWVSCWQARRNSRHSQKVDSYSLANVIKKIIYGLHYYHMRERLQQDLQVRLRLYEPEPPASRKVKPYTCGTYREFTYWLPNTSEKEQPQWTLLLYDRFLFRCQVENN